MAVGFSGTASASGYGAKTAQLCSNGHCLNMGVPSRGSTSIARRAASPPPHGMARFGCGISKQASRKSLIDPVKGTGQPPTANSVKFSPDGRWLVSTYADKVARVWPSIGGSFPAVMLQAHSAAVTSATFGPLAGGGDRRRLRFSLLRRQRIEPHGSGRFDPRRQVCG